MLELQHLLSGLRTQLGARQMSLLIYAPQNRMDSVCILHSGDEAPLPEFTDLEQASTLINGALSSGKPEMLRSKDSDGVLVCLPNTSPEPGLERRQAALAVTHTWLGIRGVEPTETNLALLHAVAPICAAHYEQQYFQRDDLLGLAGRAVFEQHLARTLAERTRQPASVALLLMSPSMVYTWNRTLGREAADQHLARVAEYLQSCLRETDVLCRYGGATFALLLSGVNGTQLEESITGITQRFAARIADTSSATTLCIGARWASASETLQRHTLVADADRALRQAKLAEQQVFVFDGSHTQDLVALDPLEGLFTGNLDHDYRAMRLLWRNMVGHNETSDSASVLEQALRHLIEHYALDAAGCALFEEGQWHMLPGSMSSDTLPWLDWAETAVAADHLVVMENAGQPVYLKHVVEPVGLVYWLAGCRFELLAADVNLLEAVLEQTSRAYQRARALELTIASQQQENEKLHDTVQRIQHRDGATSFLFESSAMRSLLKQVEAVAGTDETVLVTGESGTGKEVIARALHEQSHLADEPLVIVDCSAIPQTLFEAELFGRTKGAYTSAETASEGYIAKADGGTLFLDEIGELPIDVQAKLLRFLQEKEIRPVGGADTRRVNVRVIAATNRDLAQEVDAQRFRGDLYHRLCVLHLHIPPLRERHADILVLARHFVASYSQLHRRRRSLDASAENALMSSAWQGNVRELQHTLLRAVLLSEQETIGARDLNLDGSAAPEEEGTSTEPRLPAPESQAQMPVDPMQALRDGLRTMVSICIERGRQLPLGTWLADDLIELAYARANQVTRRAAELLGLAETTYRRQIERVEKDREAGLRVRSETWHDVVEPLLPDVLKAFAAREDSLLKEMKFLLVAIVAEQLPDDSKKAAALVGITPPTYKRHLAVIEDAA